MGGPEPDEKPGLTSRSMDYLIYDGQYATDLFKAACQNSEGEPVSFATVVDQKCAELLHTAP